MENQWTPGPWEMEHQDWKGEPSPHRIYISGDKQESYDDDENATVSWVSTSVCIVEGNATSRETTAANARLIAASPCLLAACEANMEFMSGFHSCIDEIMELAEKCQRLTAAAIAKAKGGTP